MKTIEISEEVWAAIAVRGRFGETEDDVLRRVFDLAESVVPSVGRAAQRRIARLRSDDGVRGESSSAMSQSHRDQSFATRRMSSYVQGTNLIVSFAGGDRREFPLPAKAEKDALRKARDLALKFAEENGASYGQLNAVKKALTDSGFHLTK